MIPLLLRKKAERESGSTRYLPPLASVFFIYLMLVYLLTLTPFTFSKFFCHQFFQFQHGYRAAFFGGASAGDVLLNLCMLLPFGIAVGMMMRYDAKQLKSAILVAMVSGFLLSFTIEFCQLFLPRTSSGIDIITNTIGAVCGAWLAYPIGRLDLQILIKNIYQKNQRFFGWVVLLYLLLATLILLLPVSINTFRNWDRHYALLIGNEATQNRPWRGTIYHLLIFDRVLHDDDIQKIYHHGFHKPSFAPYNKESLIEYTFDNSLSKTIDSFNDSLPLVVSLPSLLRQPGTDGMLLNGKVYLKSHQPAVHLVERLQQTNQITIIAWIKPENLNQSGPARIISLSHDPDNRNFTLGQSGAMLNFRVRTPLTGLNGSEVALLTHPVLTMNEPQFVAATFHRGEYQLYINGERTTPIIYDTSFYLPLLVNLGKNKFGKFTFCFALLFPMGWLARGLVRRKIWKSAVSSLVVIVPFFVLSSLTSMLFHHHCDLHLLLICCVVAGLVFLIGLIYDFTFLA